MQVDKSLDKRKFICYAWVLWKERDVKTVYKFKPFQHWNYITKEQYDVLRKFYTDGMIKIEKEEEWNTTFIQTVQSQKNL